MSSSETPLALTDAIRELARPTKAPDVSPRFYRSEELTSGLARASDALRPVQSWLIDVLASREALEAPIGDDAATKLHALMIVQPPNHQSAPIASLFMTAHGIDPVLRALMQPCPLALVSARENNRIIRWLLRDGDELPHGAGHAGSWDAGRWVSSMRYFFDAATDAQRASWHALVALHRPSMRLWLRTALSWLFRDTAWAEEDAVALLATDRPQPGSWDDMLGHLLPYVDSEDLFDQLAAHAYIRLGPPSVFAEILVRPPAPRAVARLTRLFQRLHALGEMSPMHLITAALACSRDEAAAAAIATVATRVKVQATAYFLAHPEHLHLLQAQAKGRTKVAAATKALVVAIERQRVAANPPTLAGDLPPVLASPPWLHRTPPWPSRALTTIVDGERILEGPWLESARKLLAKPSSKSEPEILGKNGLIDTAAFAALSDEVAFANIHRLKTFDLDAAVARFGVRALRPLAELMIAKPLPTHAEFLPHLRSPLLAPAAWGAHHSESWLLDDPALSTLGLVPGLFAEAVDARLAPELGLVRLCAAGHRAQVLQTAARYGDDVARAVAEILDRDPAQRLPVTLPALHKSLEDNSLPVLATKDGPLPPSTIPTIGMLLLVSPMWLPHPGLAELRRLCTPASRDAFAWELFGKTRELRGIAHLAGDGAVRQLDQVLSAKREALRPDERFRMYAALGQHGSALALVLLRKHAFLSPWIDREDVVEAILAEVARVRGVSIDALDDDALGALEVARALPVLDYGPRRFRVELDDHLVPRLVDEAGAPVPKLPKPTKKDDPLKADAAKVQLDALILDLDDVREMLLIFFEKAMATGRTFEAARFQGFVAHPLLVQLARRLVFVSGATFFRVAEDGTFADADDNAFSLAPDVTVRVAHPVEMGADRLARFRQIFADYEIIQPFQQLDRAVFTLTEAERDASTLPRFIGRQATPSAFSKLLGARGWRHEGSTAMQKRLSSSVASVKVASRAATSSTPATEEVAELKLRQEWRKDVRQGVRPERGDGGADVPLSHLTDVELSELVRDLETLPWV